MVARKYVNALTNTPNLTQFDDLGLFDVILNT